MSSDCVQRIFHALFVRHFGSHGGSVWVKSFLKVPAEACTCRTNNQLVSHWRKESIIIGEMAEEQKPGRLWQRRPAVLNNHYQHLKVQSVRVCFLVTVTIVSSQENKMQSGLLCMTETEFSCRIWTLLLSPCLIYHQQKVENIQFFTFASTLMFLFLHGRSKKQINKCWYNLTSSVCGSL